MTKSLKLKASSKHGLYKCPICMEPQVRISKEAGDQPWQGDCGSCHTHYPLILEQRRGDGEPELWASDTAPLEGDMAITYYLGVRVDQDTEGASRA